MEQDQYAFRVGEVALVLLDARAGEGPAEFREERAAEELRHRQIDDVGEPHAQFLRALVRGGAPDPEHVDQRAARVAHGLQHALQAPAAVVFDDDAGAGTDVGLEIGVRAPGVTYGYRHAGDGEAARERPILDDELDLEARQQDLVEHPDDQFVLTDS